jgi:SAM-dependent methyltransferase
LKPLKKLRNNLFKILHPGNACYCIYCNKSYSKFLHAGVKAEVFKKYKVAGGGYKKNTKCPNCGSTDRGRLLALFFKLRTEAFKKPTSILHISPNKSLSVFLCEHATVKHVVGALEPEKFSEFNAMKLDVQKIELDDNQFDILICCHVLEHVDDDDKAMREIHRVLKPTGFAILQVPLATNLEKTLEDKTLKTDRERKIAHGQVDHMRLYGLDYFDKLQRAGFRVVRDNPFQNKWLSEQELAKHCLDKVEDVIVAYKN